MNNWLTHGAADPYNDSVMSCVSKYLVLWSHKNNCAVETKVNSPTWLPRSCCSAEYQSSMVTLQASVNQFCSVSVYLLHFQLIYAIMWEAVCNHTAVWHCVVYSRHPGIKKTINGPSDIPPKHNLSRSCHYLGGGLVTPKPCAPITVRKNVNSWQCPQTHSEVLHLNSEVWHQRAMTHTKHQHITHWLSLMTGWLWNWSTSGHMCLWVWAGSAELMHWIHLSVTDIKESRMES